MFVEILPSLLYSFISPTSPQGLGKTTHWDAEGSAGADDISGTDVAQADWLCDRRLFTAVPGASDRHGCTGGRVAAISGRDGLLMLCDVGLDIDVLMIYVEINPRCFTWLCHCLEHPGIHANWCITICMKVNQKNVSLIDLMNCSMMLKDVSWFLNPIKIIQIHWNTLDFWGIFGKLVLVQYTVPYKRFVLAGRAWPPGGQVASQRGSSHWVEMCAARVKWSEGKAHDHMDGSSKQWKHVHFFKFKIQSIWMYLG